MASIISHAVAAASLSSAAPIPRRCLRKAVVAGCVCSILPDADVIAFMFDVPYGDVFGHRGISHSLAFALVLGYAVTALFFRQFPPNSKEFWGLTGYFFVATASHGLLDAMTNGGLGVAFFAPFENSRYFFPFRPIQVSPIGISRFFSEWGVRVLISEFFWVILPAIGFSTVSLMSKFMIRRRCSNDL